jgi:D-3-phosphoglycerate dehydrogenase
MARQVVTCLRTGVVLNGVNVPRIAPSEAALVGPYLDLTNDLAGFLTQVFAGPVESLRLTLQGAVPESAMRSLTVAMLAGALRRHVDGPVTPVNAERVAEQLGVRFHVEASSMKRDFMSLVRVEALIDGVRHWVSGTVLGHRHGRMVELDDFLLDAIPEGPALVTFHDDRPGMLGEIGTILGRHAVNISRMQLGCAENGGGGAAAGMGTGGNDENCALGIWNLSQPLPELAFAEIRATSGIRRACAVK